MHSGERKNNIVIMAKTHASSFNAWVLRFAQDDKWKAGGQSLAAAAEAANSAAVKSRTKAGFGGRLSRLTL